MIIPFVYPVIPGSYVRTWNDFERRAFVTEFTNGDATINSRHFSRPKDKIVMWSRINQLMREP